ncbi:MAG: hypothetical protein ACSLE6_17845 [Mycobacterium sp.]
MVDLWREVKVRPMSADEAADVAEWRYDGAWSVYDLCASQPLLDNLASYYVVVNCDDLVGFFCTGVEARVAGMNEESATLDVGMGMNPKLVGRGNGARFGGAVLGYLAVRNPGVTLRAVVSKLERAQYATYPTLGFQDAGELTVHQDGRLVTYRLVRRPSKRDTN